MPTTSESDFLDKSVLIRWWRHLADPSLVPMAMATWSTEAMPGVVLSATNEKSLTLPLGDRDDLLFDQLTQTVALPASRWRALRQEADYSIDPFLSRTSTS